MTGLLSVADAQNKLISTLQPTAVETVPLQAALGRIVAETVLAGSPLPAFANSSMDGFAVRAADVEAATEATPVSLRVVGDAPAGSIWEGELNRGAAVRIMTGAVLPAGSDTVIPVENTDFNDRHAGESAPEFVLIRKSEKPGTYIRQQGEDVQAGDEVLCSGHRLRPAEIGFLAMLGKTTVRVHQRPRVAVFSSGDELLPVEAPLTPGKIHDANTYTLTALLESYGAEVINLGIASDRFAAVEDILNSAIKQKVNLILSSAGVSVGAFDYVRAVVEANGQLNFWRVNMRPGKPFTYGSYQGTPFIGLPGNPVSAYVGCEVFVQPAIAKLSGAADLLRPMIQVVLAEDIISDGRESYLRAIVEPKGNQLHARLTGHQGSGNLRSLVQANALLLIPSEVKFLPPGSEVKAWLLVD